MFTLQNIKKEKMDEKSDSKKQPSGKKEDQKITIDDLLAVVRIIRNNQKAQLTRINKSRCIEMSNS